MTMLEVVVGTYEELLLGYKIDLKEKVKSSESSYIIIWNQVLYKVNSMPAPFAL